MPYSIDDYYLGLPNNTVIRADTKYKYTVLYDGNPNFSGYRPEYYWRLKYIDESSKNTDISGEIITIKSVNDKYLNSNYTNYNGLSDMSNNMWIKEYTGQYYDKNNNYFPNKPIFKLKSYSKIYLLEEG